MYLLYICCINEFHACMHSHLTEHEAKILALTFIISFHYMRDQLSKCAISSENLPLAYVII